MLNTIARLFSAPVKPFAGTAATADADEALTWPGRYLANEPLLRDALWIRALADAANIKIDRLLHRRRVKADAMLNRRKEDMPDIVRIYEDDARDVATKVVAWANAAMAKPLSEADIDELIRAWKKEPR